jgi:hypothetical protein
MEIQRKTAIQLGINNGLMTECCNPRLDRTEFSGEKHSNVSCFIFILTLRALTRMETYHMIEATEMTPALCG